MGLIQQMHQQHLQINTGYSNIFILCPHLSTINIGALLPQVELQLVLPLCVGGTGDGSDEVPGVPSPHHQHPPS